MKNKLHYIITVVILVMTTTLFAQTPEQLFEQGNKQYADGQFQEAVDSYRKVLDKDVESAAVYYNLANAHYKLNNVAPSIYYYEKAKQLAPADADIRNNAAFADKMKIDAIQPLPENTFEQWYNSVLNLLTTDGWAYATVLFIILFVVLFLGYYFSYQDIKKRAFFVSSLTCLVFAGLAIVFAYNAFAKASTDNPAIVFAAESQVKSEPNLASAEAFVLHEGTKVMIIEAVENWKRILLADGKSGWIPASDLRAL